MKTGLVLGAGGVVGMAYIAGVLYALEQEAGISVNEADLIVGTSAGAVVGAYLRAGWTTEDMWLMAMDEHPHLSRIGGEAASAGDIMAPAFRSPLELMRRGVGSAYIAARSVARRVRSRCPPSWPTCSLAACSR